MDYSLSEKALREYFGTREVDEALDRVQNLGEINIRDLCDDQTDWHEFGAMLEEEGQLNCDVLTAQIEVDPGEGCITWDALGDHPGPGRKPSCTVARLELFLQGAYTADIA
jgi:hypothetical protein